ncbi:hypothetical protein RB619_03095 [Flavobacterium sp. LHD-80]|uniref:hypothetical protein n=1 Tax=Flavobacterium sp. LHD-80 TaxID=3071411 RepID=UPI0027DF3A18|nr:hypothetical protein [Flavobacterium sp. LHD-80]MDQ6469617.1 hypothetical protein [Flavobacterium sp. LHD-80]
MKKILLLFITASLCYACEIQYDGETRIVVQGQLIDKNNNPVSNKKIEITTSTGGTFGTSDLISYANSGADGKFTLIFPAPKNDSISIVTSINQYQNNELQSKTIYGLKKNFSNYKLDLNQVVLYETKDITQLDILLNKTTNNKQVTDIQIEGLQSNSYIDLNTKKDKYQVLNTHFDVIKNQNINLSYKILDYSNPTKPVATDHKATIAINSEKVIHSITY